MLGRPRTHAPPDAHDSVARGINNLANDRAGRVEWLWRLEGEASVDE
jgi:hypothetical protein